MKYNVIMIIGPAGSGKDTLAKHLCAMHPNIFNFVLSATTRPMRENEKQNVDYIFMSEEEFHSTDMLETSNFNNWWYGTPLSSFDPLLANVVVANPQGVESYLKDKEHIEVQKIYLLNTKDKIRLLRQLNREEEPNVEEIIRRYGTDKKDFEVLNFKYISLPNNNQEDFKKNFHKILMDNLN